MFKRLGVGVKECRWMKVCCFSMGKMIDIILMNDLNNIQSYIVVFSIVLTGHLPSWKNKVEKIKIKLLYVCKEIYLTYSLNILNIRFIESLLLGHVYKINTKQTQQIIYCYYYLLESEWIGWKYCNMKFLYVLLFTIFMLE